MTDKTFHSKYRPKKLSTVIGHEQAVATLSGFIKSGNIPGAFLFTGPSSVGKTTLARCLAYELNGENPDQQSDYRELDSASNKGIDDIRELIRFSRFKPRTNKRIIVIDEAQALLSNKQAADALLKPLEEAGKTDTIWILCSMDPQKFMSTGKAIANRCTQINLKAPTTSELTKFAKRVIKKEGISLEADQIKLVVAASNGEMRGVANILQSVQASGSENLPELLKSLNTSEDDLVFAVIQGCFDKKYLEVHRALLDVGDGFGFITKLLWASKFLVSSLSLKGGRHRSVWFTPLNKRLSRIDVPAKDVARFYQTVVSIKAASASFAVPEIDLISTSLLGFIECTS